MTHKLCGNCKRPTPRFEGGGRCNRCAHHFRKYGKEWDSSSRTVRVITSLNDLLSQGVARDSGCIEWMGPVKRKHPYGSITFRNRPWITHRLAWALAKGPIPDGLCVLHRCDNPRCMNPDHLFLGTKGDNNRDRTAKGRTVAPSGEQHNQAKLTWEQVGVIRSRAANGDSCLSISKDYQVASSTIDRIVSGRLWRVA